MKKKKIKRVSVLALSLVMAFSVTSLPVYAAEMESGAASLTVNSSKVAFAGYEWWVIGKAGEGVYPQTGHITLLSANYNFGTTAFNSSNNNEYAGSTLQQYMVSIPSTYSFPDEELALITARDITDGINGQSILNQKLWALSYDEWDTIYGNGEGEEVLSYGASWWLRSPVSGSGNFALLGDTDGGISELTPVLYLSYAARPAFSLNLESVIFTSAANATDGKSAVELNDGLTSMEPISSSSTVKFTMKDNSQTLTVDVKEQVNETLEFTYSGATTGTNQYVSCVLIDESDDVAYYAKLVDCSEDESAANGSLSISLANVTDGTYTLQIFSEEANGNSYTDFCSEPVTMTLTVESSVGTVSEFDGEITGSDSGTGTTDSDSSISTTGTTGTGSTTGTADTDSTPQTGDNSTFALWIAIMLMTGAGLTSSLVFLRKRR